MLFVISYNNFGHNLLDVMFPAYVGMLEHQEHSEQPDLFALNYEQAKSFGGWLELMFNNTFDLEQLLASKKEEGLVCFKKVIVGSPFGVTRSPPNKYYSKERCKFTEEQNGFVAGRSTHMWMFRNHVLNKILNSSSETLPSKHQITIFQKSGRRGVTNSEQLASELKRVYEPEVRVVLSRPDLLSAREQMELLLNTTVLFSPCGAVSMTAVFLPPGATLIVTDFPGYQDSDLFTSDHMDAHVFNGLSWVRDLYYSIDSPEEFGKSGPLETPDPDSCLPDTSDYSLYRKYRDNAQITVKVDKLRTLIDHALYIMSN